jgi:acetylornithine deacetylase/succinyl-diaminopimelate desuccinylase-like protein
MFDEFEDPAPLTIGEMKAGDWPAQSPQKAVFTGVLGVLPDRTKEDVMKHLNEMMAGCNDEWLSENFEIEFTYRHDASVIPPDHPVVKTLESACTEGGVEPEVSAMTASCDAWWYNNQLEIPTCWFGGGDLGVAHSNNENIPVTDMLKAAEILVRYIQKWCV